MVKVRNAHVSDDLSRFLEDLKRGLPIRMLIAPAAPFVFDFFPRLLGYLHSLGVEAFYPVLPYADITVWAYYKILKERPGTKLIASACIGMNRYIQKHQELYAGQLCSVFSPLLCTARYLKTYRRMEDPLAFLSPCPLKKNEFVTKSREELVRYNITMKELYAWLAAGKVDLRQYEPFPQEACQNGQGLTLAAFGSIGKTLAALLPGTEYHVEQGLENAAAYLSQSRGFRDPQNPLVFEPYACRGGCANGPGTGNRLAREPPDFLTRHGQRDSAAIFKLFSHYDKTLRLEDFCHQAAPPTPPR
jgi:iron only hydrogenase large subunit-like protein